MSESINTADFYLGRGDRAEFLGSVPAGNPDQVEIWNRFVPAADATRPFDERSFGSAVANLLAAQGSRRALWPHGYESSADTPWTYSFDTGALYVDRFGYPFAVVYCNRGRRNRPTIKNPTRYPLMRPAPR